MSFWGESCEGLCSVQGVGSLAWAINDFGQLGSGSTYCGKSLRICLREYRLKTLGQGHPSAAWTKFTLATLVKACAVCRAGEVLAWGINDFGQLGSGSTFYETSPTKVVGLESVRIADIAAGGWHSLALTTEGGECAAHNASHV